MNMDEIFRLIDEAFAKEDKEKEENNGRIGR